MKTLSKDEGISLVVANHIGTILLDRETTRNAMSFSTWCALPGLIAAAEGDARVAVIVIRGAGGNFGSGNDIGELGRIRGDPLQSRSYGRAMLDGMLAVERATKPVIAAVQGDCYGASVALMLAADFRVAAENARFAITPAKLGALYLQSDLHRLVAAVGQGHARRMVYSAASLTAADAMAIGLIEQVVDPESFDAELCQLAQMIVRSSSFTLRHSKRMLRAAAAGTTLAQDEESLDCFVTAMQGDDFGEGYVAFKDKRAPMFSRTAS